jgi:hypothetical protein
MEKKEMDEEVYRAIPKIVRADRRPCAPPIYDFRFNSIKIK